jgi:glutaredoxin|tara:strand:- start:255 stop:578 length:324 start_codon:yes stop_codon:yes gene_type:complete
MIKYIIYTQHSCNFCNKAKDLLREAGEHFEERLLDTPAKLKRFKDAGHTTVPQIFLHIGGFNELEEFMFPEDIEFDPDIKLVEETKPTAKVLPFKIGAISGDIEKDK